MAVKSVTLFAVDTNFLLDLEYGTKEAVAAYKTLRTKVSAASLVALPTVLDELANGLEVWDSDNAELARSTLINLKRKWGIQPLDLIPTGHGLVELAADSILTAGLLPAAEKNDAFVISEAALMGCELLVSSDRHLLDIDPIKLAQLLSSRDLGQPSIKSPRQIIGMFG